MKVCFFIGYSTFYWNLQRFVPSSGSSQSRQKQPYDAVKRRIETEELTGNSLVYE